MNKKKSNSKLSIKKQQQKSKAGIWNEIYKNIFFKQFGLYVCAMKNWGFSTWTERYLSVTFLTSDM